MGAAVKPTRPSVKATAVELPAAPRPRRIWQRDQRLKSLGYATYSEYLLSPAWLEVRARYRRSGRPQGCFLCGTEIPPIVLHHRTYERVGEEELDDLVPLCRGHHNFLHGT